MATVNPYGKSDMAGIAKEAKEGANQNAGSLEVPGMFIMKVKTVKNKTGDQISPVVKVMDSGAVLLSLLLTVDDETTEHNGKGLFAAIWLKPKLIKVNEGDSPQVVKEKQEEYRKKIVNTLKMNLPSIWALTGDNTLNMDDWDRFALAIGDVNPAKHAMTRRVLVEVEFDSNNNKINFRANRISDLPSSSTVSKVNPFRLKDLNELRTALGQNADNTTAAPGAGTNDVGNNAAPAAADTPWLGGAATPGAAGASPISFTGDETVV